MKKQKEDDPISNDLEFQIKRMEAEISRLEKESESAYQRGYSRGYKAGYREAEMNDIYLEDEEE